MNGRSGLRRNRKHVATDALPFRQEISRAAENTDTPKGDSRMFTPPQAILDNAESVILLKDKQRRYITVSRRFETLFKIGRTAGQAAPSGAGG